MVFHLGRFNYVYQRLTLLKIFVILLIGTIFIFFTADEFSPAAFLFQQIIV